jgi:hypothetical protein
MKRSAMPRSLKPMKRTELKRVPGTSRKVQIKKRGARAKAWGKAWRFLKQEFQRRDITSCEFRFIPHVCWGPLDPAHSKKRGKMKGNDIYMVAIACRLIHSYLDEKCSHDEMERFVNRAIESRGVILPERLAA